MLLSTTPPPPSSVSGTPAALQTSFASRTCRPNNSWMAPTYFTTARSTCGHWGCSRTKCSPDTCPSGRLAFFFLCCNIDAKSHRVEGIGCISTAGDTALSAIDIIHSTVKRKYRPQTPHLFAVLTLPSPPSPPSYMPAISLFPSPSMVCISRPRCKGQEDSGGQHYKTGSKADAPRERQGIELSYNDVTDAQERLNILGGDFTFGNGFSSEECKDFVSKVRTVLSW